MKTFLPPFTNQEEAECLEKIGNGDLEARNELIERNMRLVAHVAKKYQGQEEDMEDLISIGTIGLIKAISTYKAEYGNRLATYAVRCIDNELLMYFRGKKKYAKEVSLYEPIGTDKEGNQIQLVDVVVSEDVDVVERLDTNQKIQRLLEIMPMTLSVRECEIIEKRYGIGREKALTQREIAKEMSISRSYVSRIEKRALEKLKRML